jgi:menaquinone-9 beta-reductase
MNDFDIIIVGAGPAGCACALSLRNSGLNIGLIDKAVFPRNKTCGDAIPGGAIKILEKIMPEAILDFEMHDAKNTITESVVVTSNGKQIKMQWVSKAYNATRVSWDNFLMQLVKSKTKTSVIENCHIKQLNYQNEIFMLSGNIPNQYTCKILISADGALAGVSKLLPNNHLNYKNTAVAVRAYYSNIQLASTKNLFVLNKQVANSYFWIFPVENNLYNVGFGVVNPIKKNGETIDVKKCFAHLIATDKNLKKHFATAILQSEIAGFKLPLYSKVQSISGNGYILCGDAAHLIDPLQGHGIDKAMHSGYLAAQQALKCFTNNIFSADYIKQYDVSVYNSIGKELQRNNRIMNLLSRMPWVADMFASIFNWSIIKNLARKWS